MTTRDSHRYAFDTVVPQPAIAAVKGLVGDLSPRVGVSAALSRVDDKVTFINIVHIAARKNNRLSLRRNASLEAAGMNASVVQRPTIGKCCSTVRDGRPRIVHGILILR